MNKSKIALAAFVASLICFGGYIFTKNYAFFTGGAALMIVGVYFTPRKK